MANINDPQYTESYRQDQNQYVKTANKLIAVGKNVNLNGCNSYHKQRIGYEKRIFTKPVDLEFPEVQKEKMAIDTIK